MGRKHKKNSGIKSETFPINPATYPAIPGTGTGEGNPVQYYDRRNTSAGQNVTVNNLITQASVYQAVYVISSGVASIDFNIVEYLKGGGTRNDYEHPYYEMVAVEPNPDTPARSFYESIVLHLLTTGNAYIEIVRNRFLEPVELYLLPPLNVTPYRESDGRLWYRVLNRPKPFPARDIIHVAAPGWDGLTGISPLNHLRNLVGVAMALDAFQAAFFSNGCKLGGVIQTPVELSEGAADRMRRDFEKIHQGSGKAHTVAVLEEGTKYLPTAATPNESQMSEAQKSQILKIAAAFNLPPTKLGIYDHTALNTLEESNLDLFNSTYFPWVDRIVKAFNRKLFDKEERKQWGIQHDLNASLKGRMIDRVQVWEKLVNLAIIDRNDVRAELGMAPKEYLDVTLIPANNLKPIEDVVNQTEEGADNQ